MAEKTYEEYLNRLNYYILALRKYYQEKGLTIIGLNDSQGVNITTTFFRKGLLDYLASSLSSEEITPTVINVFSLLMNKTEHIDYFLQNNLSLEEIKLSQIYSAIASFRKVMTDIHPPEFIKDIRLPKVITELHLPEFLGEVANAYRLVYSPKKGDQNIYLTETLRQSEEPTLIYSSGVNNLMREVGNNPFTIRGDYERKDKTPNYNYTFEKAQDPKTLETVLSGIERNFDSILSVNGKTDIYALGAYVPKALEQEGMNIFRDLIQQYNQSLQQLCKSYNITYINTEKVGKVFNKSVSNFHVSTQGHNALANHILECMYERKVQTTQSPVPIITEHPLQIINGGPQGIINSISTDYKQAMNQLARLTESPESKQTSIKEQEYQKERQKKIVEERKREMKVLQRVLDSSKTYYR